MRVGLGSLLFMLLLWLMRRIIIQSPDANATTVTAGKCFLGRPWNDLATTVYLNTFMDNSIEAVGFEPFDSSRYVLIGVQHTKVNEPAFRPVIMNTTFYAEYKSHGESCSDKLLSNTDHLAPGPGGNTTLRVSDHILDAAQASDFTIDKVFLEVPKWIDFEYQI